MTISLDIAEDIKKNDNIAEDMYLCGLIRTRDLQGVVDIDQGLRVKNN